MPPGSRCNKDGTGYVFPQTRTAPPVGRASARAERLWGPARGRCRRLRAGAGPSAGTCPVAGR